MGIRSLLSAIPNTVLLSLTSVLSRLVRERVACSLRLRSNASRPIQKLVSFIGEGRTRQTHTQNWSATFRSTATNLIWQDDGDLSGYDCAVTATHGMVLNHALRLLMNDRNASTCLSWTPRDCARSYTSWI
ncbi:hypothetical protein PV04_00199 [Phialophora macrospora]|uniref:Uncharacterized protein n=1 Tax=Phialophora macrospora TaxID=1851006 RepID=A0A0D2GI34_9EURO|nr:hypothetical protein PV04_00199 [Phialophora macrospora]